MCEHGPFNCDLLVQKEFDRLVKDFNVKEIVETGTFLGHSTNYFSKIADKVYTIEMAEVYYNDAVKRFENQNNIKLYLGDTRKVLPGICEELNKNYPPLFFLDAHGGCDPKCPLDVELNTIASRFKDNCIIVIDDFRVPNRDFYNDGFTLSKFEPYVNKCYSEGNCLKYFNDKFFYDPNTPMKNVKKGSGRLFVIPKNLSNNPLKYVNHQNGYYYSNINL